MDDPYVEMRNGGYYVRGHRVSLDSIVIYWQRGETPEELQKSFPTLELAEVYGAIAYYLGHQAEIDKYLLENEALYYAQRAAVQAADPGRYARMRQRLAEARKRMEATPEPSAS